MSYVPGVWSRRLLAALQIAAVTSLLIIVFAFGAWLTWPNFPVGRKLVAISLNGEPIIWAEPGTKLPTLEVRARRSSFRLVAGGTGNCNGWAGEVTLIPPNIIRWSNVFQTAVSCAALPYEERYFRALLRASLWRTEKGTLILENGTDVLRFKLAPG